MTRVLPEPAPARTRRGPSTCEAASRWAGVRSASRSMKHPISGTRSAEGRFEARFLAGFPIRIAQSRVARDTTSGAGRFLPRFPRAAGGALTFVDARRPRARSRPALGRSAGEDYTGTIARPQALPLGIEAAWKS